MITTAYIEITEADEYFRFSLYSEPWDDASEETKEKALVSATRSIEKLSFRGIKTDEDQLLEFPRNGETVVPAAVKQACCEEALALLSGKNPEEIADQSNVTSHRFASVSTSYDTDVRKIWEEVGLMSKVAFDLLVPYIGSNELIRVERG